MDCLRLAIAIGPLAVYLFVLGVIHMGRRPFVVAGARDMAVLLLALFGFVFIGPMQLFVPPTSALHYQGLVWGFLGAMYLAVISLVLLGMRQRIVVYNAQLSGVRDKIRATVAELDAEASWAGDAVDLPTAGLAFYIEDEGLRSVSIVATNRQQMGGPWRRLELALRENLSAVEVAPTFLGRQFLAMSVVLLALVVAGIVIGHDGIPQALAELFFP